jgi:glutathione S-transferase
MHSDSTPYLLYYSPGAASMAVHWMLIELGVAFDTQLVDIDAGQQHDPAYLRLNPAGRVPTLMVDGAPRHESAALLMLLAERHPDAALAPAPGSAERAAWLEMMVYLANTILPAMRDWFYAGSDGEPAGADAVRALACRRLDAAWDKLDAHLGESRDYLIGDQLGTADFMAVMLMRWTRNMPRPALGWPNLARYIRKQRALPSFIELNTREGLTEWRNQDD